MGSRTLRRRPRHPTPGLLPGKSHGGGAWWAAVHGVANSRTRLSNFTFTFHFHALEKEMATHSSVLAWRIPGTGEPRGLPSMGSHRVGHDWSDLAARTLRDRNATDHWPMFIQMRSKKSLREPSEAWSMGQKIENSPIYSVNNTIQVITLDSKLYLFYYFFSSFIFKVQLCVKRE